jgi:hypothetical protein
MFEEIIRLVKMGGKWYATKITLNNDLENIEEFINSGEPVLLVADIADIPDEIEDYELV